MNKDCPYCETKCQDITCPCPKYLAYVDVQDPNKVKQILDDLHFDTSLPDWDLMYSMQRSFEQRFHKIDNLTKEEMDNWINKYIVCIEDEVREVRECLNLYNNRCDIKPEELKKEVIDILHFMMDLFIAGGATAQDIARLYSEKYHVNSDNIITTAYAFQSKYIYEYLNIYSVDKLDWGILKATCKLLDACAQVRQQISWKHWKKPNSDINIDKLFHAYVLVFHEFINLCILTMTVEEIKTIYVKKNVENIQRQKYGY